MNDDGLEYVFGIKMCFVLNENLENTLFFLITRINLIVFLFVIMLTSWLYKKRIKFKFNYG